MPFARGYSGEHLGAPERCFGCKKHEWTSGGDFEKEFAPDILVDGISCDLIVEEPDHPRRFCDAVERHCREAGNGGRILFDIGL
ncbi:MAG: hypothetical protein MUC76_09050 [Spirochaetes bacterium]|jgi:hypothetical protein|nr:hypothetical protein [Spirochaetota bacterium]